MTTAIAKAASGEEKQAALKKTAGRSKQSAGLATLLTATKTIELRLLSLDFESGDLLRTIALDTIQLPEAIHPLNSYASPTPVLDDSNIYCHFGENGTFCVDCKSGKVVWHRKLPVIHNVGAGGSPMLYDDKLVLIQDGVKRQFVTALDTRTGASLWETDRPAMVDPDADMHKAFSTAIAITDKLGRAQLICLGPQWIAAYQPDSGKEIWRCYHGRGYSQASRPLFADGVVYFSAAHSTLGMWAIRVDGSGDVSDTHVEWVIKKGTPIKPSPVLHDGLMFLIDDSGVATCIDVAAGAIVWAKRVGGDYSSSALLAGGHVYFSSHDGKVTVIKPNRAYRVVAKNQLDGRIMASPAAISDSLIMRTDKGLYRFRQQK